MKKLYSKIPTMIAMALTLASLVMRLADIISWAADPSSGLPLHQRRLGEEVALLALLFFGIDAILALVKVCMRINPVENAFTVLFLLLAFFTLKYPDLCLIGVSNADLKMTLYNNADVMCVTLLSLPQLLSVLQHAKSKKAGRESGDLAPRIARYMKTVYSKIPAMIAVLLSLISFFILISALVMHRSEPTGGCLGPPSMDRAYTGMAVAMWAGLFLVIDALFSVVKIFLRKRPLFHGLSALAILALIPFPCTRYYFYSKVGAMAVVLALLIGLEAVSILLAVWDEKKQRKKTQLPSDPKGVL